MGPAAIITVGVLFLLDQLHGEGFSFWNTWPIILIVLGVISLASAAAPADGHISEAVRGSTPGTPGPLPTPPQNQLLGQGPGR
jgi:hypothetical protein